MTIKLDARADAQQETIHLRFLIMISFKADSETIGGQGLILRPVTRPDNERKRIENEHERISVFECRVPIEDVPWCDCIDETTNMPLLKEEVLNIT